MRTASQCISDKLTLFFNQFDPSTKSHLHQVLSDELKALQHDTCQLSSNDFNSINALHHKYKGICRYLRIENEILSEHTDNKIVLLVNIQALQQSLEDV
ncbi:hypothetical protein L2719_17570 [Shewanella schlegeliana]|uniref:HPt domain-containing protein n=1 Tax=Shewanella schlegeliana TaxID=190308 RepID=A0ABS1SU53_9GAMM|nr:hypothetical protein [Shewanella schlegeliana]MBL4912060.1 hypothetical protein [Shewanella schlegeliana]MCL1111343.1 hypothetical protein [Shewanella schlegeliana]GIU33091.1 hypothetical protein TUM4433_26970 [Shewanella schlegeliana]